MCPQQNRRYEFKSNMIKGINESRLLAKPISRECRCKFDGRKCNSRQIWNNDKCQCACKKTIKHCAKKIMSGISVHVLECVTNIVRLPNT